MKTTSRRAYCHWHQEKSPYRAYKAQREAIPSKSSILVLLLLIFTLILSVTLLTAQTMDPFPEFHPQPIVVTPTRFQDPIYYSGPTYGSGNYRWKYIYNDSGNPVSQEVVHPDLPSYYYPVQ